MLSINMKKTEKIDLQTPLKNYINGLYLGKDLIKLEDDIIIVQETRDKIYSSCNFPASDSALSKMILSS